MGRVNFISWNRISFFQIDLWKPVSEKSTVRFQGKFPCHAPRFQQLWPTEEEQENGLTQNEQWSSTSAPYSEWRRRPNKAGTQWEGSWSLNTVSVLTGVLGEMRILSSVNFMWMKHLISIKYQSSRLPPWHGFQGLNSGRWTCSASASNPLR